MKQVTPEEIRAALNDPETLAQALQPMTLHEVLERLGSMSAITGKELTELTSEEILQPGWILAINYYNDMMYVIGQLVRAYGYLTAAQEVLSQQGDNIDGLKEIVERAIRKLKCKELDEMVESIRKKARVTGDAEQ